MKMWLIKNTARVAVKQGFATSGMILPYWTKMGGIPLFVAEEDTSLCSPPNKLVPVLSGMIGSDYRGNIYLATEEGVAEKMPMKITIFKQIEERERGEGEEATLTSEEMS